jgi:hypothetical protein
MTFRHNQIGGAFFFEGGVILFPSDTKDFFFIFTDEEDALFFRRGLMYNHLMLLHKYTFPPFLFCYYTEEEENISIIKTRDLQTGKDIYFNKGKIVRT